MPLSPVTSTVRSLPCSRWIRSATRCIAGAGADEAGKQRLERSLDRARRRLGRPLARRAQLESLAQHRAQRAEALQHRRRERPHRRHRGHARRRSRRGRSPRRPAAPTPAPPSDRDAAPRHRARRLARRSRRRRRRATSPGRGCVKITAACASHASSSVVVPSLASRAGVTAASTIRRTSAASPSTGDPRKAPVAAVGIAGHRGARLLADPAARRATRRSPARRRGSASRATARPAAPASLPSSR